MTEVSRSGPVGLPRIERAVVIIYNMFIYHYRLSEAETEVVAATFVRNITKTS